MSFIETETGWVSIAHIARIDETVETSPIGLKCSRYTLYGPSNKDLLGVALGLEESDLRTILSPIVPAAAGAVAHKVWINPHGARPTEDDVYVITLPVLAWRIAQHDYAGSGNQYAYPIMPEPHGTATSILLPTPDGGLFAYEDDGSRTYEDLNAAKACILREAQDAWDSSHPTG